MSDTFEWYLGIDWGSTEHRFCLVNRDGRVCDECAVAHTTVDVHAALQAIRVRAGVAAAEIAVGLEMPRGVLVDALLDQGFSVFALNPKQLDGFVTGLVPAAPRMIGAMRMW